LINPDSGGMQHVVNLCRAWTPFVCVQTLDLWHCSRSQPFSMDSNCGNALGDSVGPTMVSVAGLLYSCSRSAQASIMKASFVLLHCL
jgi:hypothetical protein